MHCFCVFNAVCFLPSGVHEMTSFIPPISKLSSKVIRVLGCNPGPMTLQGTNTYVIGSGPRRILIDTGSGGKPQYVKNLTKILTEEKIKIDHVVITHWHEDHIGGVPEIKSLLEKGSTVWKYKRSDSVNEAYHNNVSLNYLKDGEELKAGDCTLRVIHTPGHTTDHISLFLKEENALFSGDCILGEGTAVFEDLYDYMVSLELMLGLKARIIYPGHGPIVENPNMKIKEYINHRKQRESQILQVLRTNDTDEMTEMELVRIIYVDTPEVLFKAAALNVNHHLLKLERENKVQKGEKGWLITKTGNVDGTSLPEQHLDKQSALETARRRIYPQ